MHDMTRVEPWSCEENGLYVPPEKISAFSTAVWSRIEPVFISLMGSEPVLVTTALTAELPTLWISTLRGLSRFVTSILTARAEATRERPVKNFMMTDCY